MKILLAILSCCVFLNSYGQNNSTMKSIDNTPVTGFELERYLGTWYEIARFNHRFEKNLVGVTATYSMKNNGMVKVVNKGYKRSLEGKESKAVGKARLAGKESTGHLNVSFFLFFYSDYYIMELDKENYQWALVGSSSPNYLWILCRKPVIDEDLYNDLIRKAAAKGYNLAGLQRVPQKN